MLQFRKSIYAKVVGLNNPMKQIQLLIWFLIQLFKIPFINSVEFLFRLFGYL